jgi:type II secretory pathway pseudopilin PulG
MVVLLVGLSIMAVMTAAVMPVWRQIGRREKETELVFRGEQYARAIGLFQRKNGPGTLPPSFDVLVEQRYLRKKFKDPITNDDFAVIGQNAVTQGAGETAPTAPTGTATAPATTGRAGAPGPTGARGGTSPFAVPNSSAGATVVSGIAGVSSKSKDQSIRLYKGRNHYNEWAFIFTAPAAAAGAGGVPGAPGVGGARGGRGTQPGQAGPGRGAPPGGTTNPTPSPFGGGRQTQPGRGAVPR